MKIPKTLLIVEDEPALREIIRDAVEEHVERFLEAANGEEALKLLAMYKIHAVITDITMPVMDGLELLKRMREEKIEVPCTILTGNVEAYPDLKQNAFKWGIQILEKPIAIDLLSEAVRNTMEVGLKLSEIGERLDTLCKEKNIPEAEQSSFRKQERAGVVEKLMKESLTPFPIKKVKS